MVEDEEGYSEKNADVIVTGGIDSDEDVEPDLYGEADDREYELGLTYSPPGAPLNRPRGVLSQRDREYLYGESEIEPKSQSERNVRGTIRDRVKHGLIDFTILLRQLPDRDRRQIFDSFDRDVRSGIADTLGFLYQETDPTRYDFEELLEMGIDHGERAALHREGHSSDFRGAGHYYNVDLKVERVAASPNPPDTLNQIGNQIAGGNAGDLTAAEIRMFFDYYAYADEFDPELPAKVFSSLHMGIDAARQPRESLKRMRKQTNTSLEDYEAEDEATDNE